VGGGSAAGTRRAMTINYERGFFRIWVILLALSELIIFALAFVTVREWYFENYFAQFDAGYVGILTRLFPFLIAVIVTAAIFTVVWLATKYIARGFTP
jgi:hypothetical protein